MHPLEYYSRKDIQNAILESCKSRELSFMLGIDRFGKRPETANYESDILEFAKQGATSFHISEERWKNPLNLVTGMSRKQLDDLRIGWDFILDIDHPNLKISKMITYRIIEFLRFLDIKNISLKFSGNKGFHIGIPFESFPKTIGGKNTEETFPETARVLAEYLKSNIVETTSKLKEGLRDLKIDTVLVSSRHLYRAPYSIHEKSGLVSLPINPDRILEFKREEASPDKVKPEISFLKDYKEDEAYKLLMQAYDWYEKEQIKQKFSEEVKEKATKEKATSFYDNSNEVYDELNEAIPEEFFPSSIKQGLEGLKDGKKRFLYVLINFLKCLDWNYKDIDKRVKEWNQNNPEPLKEGYIISQLSWHKRQKEKILPPNYSNDEYYRDLGLKCSDLERKFKNPLSYAVRRFRISKKQKK